jgi:hypothetical protein
MWKDDTFVYSLSKPTYEVLFAPVLAQQGVPPLLYLRRMQHQACCEQQGVIEQRSIGGRYWAKKHFECLDQDSNLGPLEPCYFAQCKLCKALTISMFKRLRQFVRGSYMFVICGDLRFVWYMHSHTTHIHTHNPVEPWWLRVRQIKACGRGNQLAWTVSPWCSSVSLSPLFRWRFPDKKCIPLTIHPAVKVAGKKHALDVLFGNRTFAPSLFCAGIANSMRQGRASQGASAP